MVYRATTFIRSSISTTILIVVLRLDFIQNEVTIDGLRNMSKQLVDE